MAKKKSTQVKSAKVSHKATKAPAVKKHSLKKPAATKPAKKSKPVTQPKVAVKKKTTREIKPLRGSPSAKPPAFRKAVSKNAVSLGRPTLTADEPLYLVFKEDYHARQIFEFLRVQTVRELEEHAPKEIFDRLTKPVRESVDRIRRFLAERNRCLIGDEEFAIAYKQRLQAQEDLARNS